MMFKILLIFWLIVFFRWAFPLGVTVGNSMYPTHKDGDILVFTRLFFVVKPSKVYLFTRKLDNGETRHIIKRVSRIKDGCQYYVLGDNPDESLDSRYYGYLSNRNLVGKYLFTIRRRKY